jgi:hypothetical protein
MKRSNYLLCAVLLVLVVTCQAADYYKLPSVKRLDKDLYRSGNLLIETRFCFHLTFGEDAILKYEGPGEYSGTTIIWEDNSSCEVSKVVKVN